MVMIAGCTPQKTESTTSGINGESDQDEVNNNDEQLPEEDWINAETVYLSDDYDYINWKTYINEELGYSVKYPADWRINDAGLSQTGELIIEPSNPEPFVAYVSIGIDNRELELIRTIYKDSDRRFRAIDPNYKPDEESKIYFSGKKSYYYITDNNFQNRKIVCPFNDRIYSISTHKNDNVLVRQIISSVEFK
jgi:hypothetical protein